MGKYVLIFFVWLVIVGGIIISTNAVATDNITTNMFACQQSKPTLVLITQGNLEKITVIGGENRKYEIRQLDKEWRGIYIRQFQLQMDGKIKTIDNPNQWSGEFSKVYDKQGNLSRYIEVNKYYYIYNLNDNRLVFSEVTKKLDSEGNIVNTK